MNPNGYQISPMVKFLSLTTISLEKIIKRRIIEALKKKKDKENQPQPVAVSSLLQQRVRQTFAKEKVCPDFGRDYINANVLPR